MKHIRGKNALVTGAASGIGRALALALAQEGVNLFLVDIDTSGLAAVAAEAGRLGVKVAGEPGDLAQTAEVSRLVQILRDAWEGLDILVNNAGVTYIGPTERMSPEQWDRLLAVNLHAPIHFTLELLPSLLARRGHILNVCSLAGLIGVPDQTAYSVTKFGLVGFSESLRLEFGARGLGVTALCPGLIRTNLFSNVMTAPDAAFHMPPDWNRVLMSPEHLAVRAVRAIRRNQGQVVWGRGASLLWAFKRYFPRLYGRLQTRYLAASHK